jgi:hypothetical protein
LNVWLVARFITWRRSCPTSLDVFRATLFSLVLSFVAPQTILLCKLWCQPSDAATSRCNHHDQASSPSVKADDRCGVVAERVRSFIREDGPRVTAGSDAGHAVPVPRYRLTRPTSGPGTMDRSDTARALARRPLDTTLRL